MSNDLTTRVIKALTVYSKSGYPIVYPSHLWSHYASHWKITREEFNNLLLQMWMDGLIEKVMPTVERKDKSVRYKLNG